MSNRKIKTTAKDEKKPRGRPKKVKDVADATMSADEESVACIPGASAKKAVRRKHKTDDDSIELFDSSESEHFSESDTDKFETVKTQVIIFECIIIDIVRYDKELHRRTS